MRRRAFLVLATGAMIGLAGLVPVVRTLRRRALREHTIEGFGPEGSERWELTSAGDFGDRTVDVVPSPEGARLRVRVDTVGTNDRSVKYVGARRWAPVDLGPGRTVGVEVDWNGQQNGSYLSAGFVLSPTETTGNPLDGPDWLKVEYIGVPPGQQARLAIVLRYQDRERTLYDDGWPQHNRSGRPIALQHIVVESGAGAFSVLENGRCLYSAGTPLQFRTAHLYLQVSSHSNFGAREVFFAEPTTS